MTLSPFAARGDAPPGKLARPYPAFYPGNSQRITTSSAGPRAERGGRRPDLKAVLAEFDSRHLDIESCLLANYEKVLPRYLSASLSVRAAPHRALFSANTPLNRRLCSIPLSCPPRSSGVEEGACALS